MARALPNWRGLVLRAAVLRLSIRPWMRFERCVLVDDEISLVRSLCFGLWAQQVFPREGKMRFLLRSFTPGTGREGIFLSGEDGRHRGGIVEQEQFFLCEYRKIDGYRV